MIYNVRGYNTGLVHNLFESKAVAGAMCDI